MQIILIASSHIDYLKCCWWVQGRIYEDMRWTHLRLLHFIQSRLRLLYQIFKLQFCPRALNELSGHIQMTVLECISKVCRVNDRITQSI